MATESTRSGKSRQRREAESERSNDTTTESGHGVDSAHKTELDADVDAVLDEIDDVLEENAEEFVRSFVQKGGE